jgi:hypothetical protein
MPQNKLLFPLLFILFSICLISIVVHPVKTFADENSPGVRPRFILWAWDRHEDLSFINPREIGVAFLAQTINISGNMVHSKYRLQPVEVPEGTFIIAVVRIQSQPKQGTNLSPDLKSGLVSMITEISNMSGISAVQIDFDARASERHFYRDLLVDLRKNMKASISLSITALASWCTYDGWIYDLPISEAVPMFFRMGPERAAFIKLFENGNFIPLCQRSVGISTDDKALNGLVHNRFYIFSPKAWTMESVNKIIGEVRK